MKPIERKYELNFSISLIKETLKDLNLNYEVEIIKTKNKNLQTTYIYNETNSSCGKGIGEQSLASGLFEFLEHYLYAKNEIETFDKKDFNELKQIFKYDNSVDNFLLFNTGVENIESVLFTEYVGNKKLYIPKFLCFIDKNENKYKKATQYVSNNGIATGVSKEEALLHALNELIERNSLSQHFIDVFLLKKQYKKINKNSLPLKLKKLLFDIETEINDEIEIIKIDEIFKVKTFLVYVKDKTKRKYFSGSGSSIIAEYALERALLECLQLYHIFNIDEQIKIDTYEKVYDENKLYKYSNILNLKYNDNFIFEDFKINIYKDYSVDDMVNIIVKELNNKDYKVFIKEIFSKNNIYCLKAIVPNFEKFHLVRSGIPVLPNLKNFNKIMKQKEGKND